MSSKFGQIGPWTTELAALERLKKSHRLIKGKMMPAVFDKIVSYLQVMRTCIEAWMISNSG